MPDCEHDEISDAGICKSCGTDITSQEFLDTLPEVSPDFQLGDIMGIIKLAQATAREFLDRVETDRDPHNPSQPKLKLRWMGNQLMRPPRETVWMEVLQPTFDLAKGLGYRGNMERWESVCMEYVSFLLSTKIP